MRSQERVENDRCRKRRMREKQIHCIVFVVHTSDVHCCMVLTLDVKVQNVIISIVLVSLPLFTLKNIWFGGCFHVYHKIQENLKIGSGVHFM